MASDPKSTAAEMMKQAQGLFALNTTITPQMERFWKAQDGLLEETEAYSRRWFERRHEAARSAIDALHRADGNGADPSAAMQAMADWQQHSLQRLTEDMQQWMDLCSRCATRMTDGRMASGTDGAGKQRKTGSAAGSG